LRNGGHHEAGGGAHRARLDDGALDRIDHAWVTGSAASVVNGWVRLGSDERLASGIRVVERLGAVLYLMPRPRSRRWNAQKVCAAHPGDVHEPHVPTSLVET
jgi:hypothetical protein